MKALDAHQTERNYRGGSAILRMPKPVRHSRIVVLLHTAREPSDGADHDRKDLPALREFLHLSSAERMLVRDRRANFSRTGNLAGTIRRLRVRVLPKGYSSVAAPFSRSLATS